MNEQKIEIRMSGGDRFARVPTFIFNQELSAYEIAVLSCLYGHKPFVNPSIARISSLLKISHRSVSRCLLNLSRKNLVGRTLKRGARTIYTLHDNENDFMTNLLNKSTAWGGRTLTQPLQTIKTLSTANDDIQVPPGEATKEDNKLYKKEEDDFIYLSQEEKRNLFNKMWEEEKQLVKVNDNSC